GIRFYRYIGDTSGYGHLHISAALYERLRDFLRMKKVKISREIHATHNFRLKIVSRALRHLGLNERKFLRHNLRKGIFVSPLAKNWKGFLLCEDSDVEAFNFPFDEIV